MLNCPRCGADYSEQGLDNGRCRHCGNVISWGMTASPSAGFVDPSAPRQPSASTDSSSRDGWLSDEPSSPSISAAKTRVSPEPLPASEPRLAAQGPDAQVPGEQGPAKSGPGEQGPAEHGAGSDVPGDARRKLEATVNIRDISATVADVGRLSDRDPRASADAVATQPKIHSGTGAAGANVDQKKTRELHTGTVAERPASDRANAEILNTVESQWQGQLGTDQPISHTIKSSVGETTIPDHLVVPRRAVRSVEEGLGGRQDYELLEVIGRGGEGVVHAARQASIDRTVALKMIRGERTGDSTSRLKFLSEAVVTGDLEHPNIVPIYDLGTTNEGALFYAMKRIKGTPWSDVIRKKSQLENINILMRTADAVALAHSRGVVHRDLKPENVMLGDFGEILLTDWGISLCTETFSKKQSVFLSRGLGGSPAYMAPEMATGPIEKIGPPADIYLLGAILYEIVTGRPPHHADTVKNCLLAAAHNEILPTDVKGELVDIARRAMMSNPEARFTSVQEFQDAINAHLSHSESVLLSDQASADLQRAKQSLSYDDFSAAVFGFQKAIELWSGNRPAAKSLIVARVEYATAALSKGDLDLALSLLDPQQVRHHRVRKQVLAAQAERDARQHRLKSMRRFAALLLLGIFVGGSYAFVRVNAAKTAADKSAETAQREKKEADKQRVAAELSKREADRAKDSADRSAATAIEEKINAEAARDQATAALRRANRASYSSSISLAVNSIANNAFEDARMILLGQKNDPEQSPLRHWEWGRQMFLSLGGDPDSPSGTAVDSLEAAGEVMSVAVSPALDRLAAATMSGEISLWHRDSTTPDDNWVVTTVLPGDVTIQSVAFSPAGDLLAAGGDDGVIRVYRLDDLDAEPQRLSGHRGGVTSVDFSPNSDRLLLASASNDRTIKLWPLDAPDEVRTLVGHTAEIWSIAFSRRGDRLVSASNDYTARVWGVESGQEFQRFRQHQEPVFCAAFSPDGKWVASGGYDKRLLVWPADRVEPVEATLVREVTERLQGDSHQPTEPDSRQLLGHTASVRSVAFSDDGQRIVSGARDNTLRLWRFADPATTTDDERVAAATPPTPAQAEQAIQVLRGHGGWVSGCRFLGSDQIVSGSYDRKLKLWRPDRYRELESFDSITRPILSASYSPDGRTVILAFDDGTAGVWDIASAERVGLLDEGHEFLATSAVFLPDGERMATIAGDDTLRMWDVNNGSEIWSSRGTGRRGLLALSPDGSRILTGSSEGKIAQLWDTDDGKLVRIFDTEQLAALRRQYPEASTKELEKQVADITAVSFSAAGDFVVTADSSGTCRLWQFDQPDPLLSFRGHDRAVTALQWLPDGDTLLTASTDGSVAFWNPQSGEELPGPRLVHENSVSLLTVSADGSSAISVAADQTGGQRLHYWDLDQRQVTAVYPQTDGNGVSPEDGERRPGLALDQPDAAEVRAKSVAVSSVAFSPDQSEALIATFNTQTSRYEIWKWDLAAGRLGPLEDGELRAGLVFSAEYAKAAANRILTVGGSGARFWDRRESREVMSYQPHGAILSVDYSSSGNRIVTTGSDRSIKVWRRNPASEHWLSESKMIGEHRGAILVAKFVPNTDDRVIVSGGDDGRTIIWKLTGEQLRWEIAGELTGHTGPVHAVAVSPDGKLIATGSEDQTLRLWDREATTQIKQFELHRGAILSVAFSADSRRLISGGGDNLAIVWDIASGRKTMSLVGHSAAVNAVAFSPDGWRALTGSQDNTIKLWDTDTASSRGLDEGQEILSLAAHQREVTAVQFSPDGKQVLSAGRDRQAILWNSIDVDPAIVATTSRVRYAPGDPPVTLLPDAQLKHPTHSRFAGWQLRLRIADEALLPGESLGIDEAAVAALGWERRDDAFFIPSVDNENDNGDNDTQIATLFDREDAGEAAGNLNIEFGTAISPQMVAAVIRVLTYQRSADITPTEPTSESDPEAEVQSEPDVRQVIIELHAPDEERPISTQTIDVQSIANDG